MKKIINHLTKDWYKYILELIVITAGVLGAFALNNWNDQRINKQKEELYYFNLLDDLAKDMMNLELKIKEADTRLAICKNLLVTLAQKNTDQGELFDMFFQGFRRKEFISSDQTLTDLLSSGSLVLIKNDSVKSMLLNYYNDVDDVFTKLRANDEFSTRQLGDGREIMLLGWSTRGNLQDYLGEDVIKTIEIDNWHKDEKSDNYRKFQADILLTMQNAAREKQLCQKLINHQQPLRAYLERILEQ